MVVCLGFDLLDEAHDASNNYRLQITKVLPLFSARSRFVTNLSSFKMNSDRGFVLKARIRSRPRAELEKRTVNAAFILAFQQI